MRARSIFSARHVTTFQGINIGEVFVYRRRVAGAFIRFIPLEMIVKNQRNHVLKFLNEPVGHDTVDRCMKSFIKQSLNIFSLFGWRVETLSLFLV